MLCRMIARAEAVLSFEAKTRAPGVLLPSHHTINEGGTLLSDRRLEGARL